ncbi:DUF1492 domain-containing protein [Paenibacillus ehimensis]|uniref:DUF1492 domain-containing protein n=1 Tax=Paenibacillus ehimensis TaxID=79264 RepID=UPI000685E2CC|nr:DUF1492 domain-containing protein [Paenibacillus ehimensis]
MKVLEKYPIGNGMTLNAVSEDDKLQELHRQLRGLPSYMYLTKHEQHLETVAHAYLTRYPVGTRAQLEAVPRVGTDAEDDKLLRELRGKIEKVIEARGGHLDDFEATIERITELQDLEQQRKQLDLAIDALGEYKPQYAELLRKCYVDGLSPSAAADEMNISLSTYYLWRRQAFKEFAALIGLNSE